MGDPVPAWAEFFRSGESVGRFESAVRAYFKKRKLPAVVDNGYARVGATKDDEAVYGLTNVGQLCAGSPEKEWPALITRHFDTIRQSQAGNDEAAENIGDFAWVRKRLVLRLWDRVNDSIEKLQTVRREVIPGIWAILAIDLPESIRTVTPDEAAAWDRSDDALFEEATDNVEQLAAARQVQPFDLPEGHRILAITGESVYVAPLVLRLERFPEVFGQHGAFVGIPTRNTILTLKFDDIAVVGPLSHLMTITTQMDRDGPGSVSHRVHWVKEGVWVEIPYEFTDGQLNVRPPDELVAVLNELGGGEDENEGDGETPTDQD